MATATSPGFTSAMSIGRTSSCIDSGICVRVSLLFLFATTIVANHSFVGRFLHSGPAGRNDKLEVLCRDWKILALRRDTRFAISRRNLSQLRDCRRHNIEHSLDFLFLGVATQAEANAAAGFGGRQSNRG